MARKQPPPPNSNGALCPIRYAQTMESHPINEELTRLLYLKKEKDFIANRNAKEYLPYDVQPFRIPAAGDAVQVTGMRHHAQLNGAKGQIEGTIDAKGFLTVHLQADAGNKTSRMKVRANCLRPLATSSSSPALMTGLAAAASQQDGQQKARRHSSAARTTSNSRSRSLGSGAVGAAATATLNTSSSQWYAAKEANKKLAQQYYDDALRWQKDKEAAEYAVVSCDCNCKRCTCN